MPTVEEIRLYARIERTMKETGILDRLAKGSAHFDDYQETLTVFLESLAKQLSKQQGMRWVKAKERTSPHYEKVAIRYRDILMIAFYDTSVKQYRAGTRLYELKYIEWLDESTNLSKELNNTPCTPK